jgi:site-specific DNA-methyltransferase (adenine-specific)
LVNLYNLSRIILGDALDKLRKLKDNSVDHCITDPPYNISGYDNKKNIGWLKSNKIWTEDKKYTKIDQKWDSFGDDDYEEFTTQWLTEIFRIVKPNGNLIIFGTYHNIYKIGYILQSLDRKIINSIVWYKRNAFPNITQRMLCESTEHIIWAVNNSQKDATKWVFNYNILKQFNNGKQLRNVWDIPMTSISEKRFGKHPSQKPKEVINRLILGCSNEKEIILDPFLGSGTVAMMAKYHNRKYIGIDNNSEYIDLAKKRINAVKPLKKLNAFNSKII